MNARTEVNMFTVGGSIISTVHRIEQDGSETHSVLSVSEPVELRLEPEAPKLAVRTARPYYLR